MSARSTAAPPRPIDPAPRRPSEPPQAPASSERPIAAAPPPPGDWFVCVAGGQPVGPVRAELVVQGLCAGRVPLEAYALRRGSNAWTPVLAIPLFVRALERIHGRTLLGARAIER